MGYRLWTPEEDKVLRELAGKVPASVIAEQIGRPKSGIYHRCKRLDIDLIARAEQHWNCKYDSLMISAMHTLKEAGFTVNEISSLLKGDPSPDYVFQVTDHRTRRHG